MLNFIGLCDTVEEAESLDIDFLSLQKVRVPITKSTESCINFENFNNFKKGSKHMRNEIIPFKEIFELYQRYEQHQI